jgi:hypothetical protein
MPLAKSISVFSSIDLPIIYNAKEDLPAALVKFRYHLQILYRFSLLQTYGISVMDFPKAFGVVL